MQIRLDRPTSIRLPEDMKRELKSAADAEGQSAHYLIVLILRKWLDKAKRKRTKGQKT